MPKTNKQQPPVMPDNQGEPLLPEWVDDTPEASSYNLTMYAGDGNSEQELNLTRAEYIELKHRLAEMRGFPAPTGRKNSAKRGNHAERQ